MCRHCPPGKRHECSVEGCGSLVDSRGLCNKHYKRMRQYGSTDSQPKPTLRDRLLAKYLVNEVGCWVWQAARNDVGYGQIGDGRAVLYAHRVSYELHVGPIPDGLHIDHLCRNRACINPEHLEPVTPAENVWRGEAPTVALARANRCSKGHDLAEHGYVRRNGRGRICKLCQRARAIEADALADEAAGVLGISRTRYLQQYGRKRAVAEAFIAGSGAAS